MVDNNKTLIEKSEVQRNTVVDDNSTCIELSLTSESLSVSTTKSITLNNIKYLIIRQLEVHSGEADLFLIEDDLKQDYVLKLYRPKIEPKEEIIKTLKLLSEKCVIKIVETGKTFDGRFYEIQEFAKNGSLREYLKNNSPVSKEFIHEFIQRLNNCLNEIHCTNIIHRDIKPSNILIKNINPLEIVLTDFGISSVSELSLHQTNLNRTILYSSPESMTGIISKATDYWSFGMIVLEMLLNKHPFGSLDDTVVMYTLTTKNVPFIDQINNEFIFLIKGLLTREDKKRWGKYEVDCWINGINIPTHFDEVNNTKDSFLKAKNIEPQFSDLVSSETKLRPYKFNGSDYYSLEELSISLAREWSMAILEFKTRKIHNWVVKHLNNINIHHLIADLMKDRMMSIDEKLFEFLCRINKYYPLIYKGILLTKEKIIDLSINILKKSASEEEKYFEINGNEKLFNVFQTLLNDWKMISDDVNEMAQIALINYSNNYKLNLINIISNKIKESVIIKPINGYSSVAESIEKVNSIIKNSQHNNYSSIDLLRISNASHECFISKDEFKQNQAQQDKKKIVELLNKNVNTKVKISTLFSPSKIDSHNNQHSNNITDEFQLNGIIINSGDNNQMPEGKLPCHNNQHSKSITKKIKLNKIKIHFDDANQLPEGELSLPLINGFSMDFVSIPPGTFLMGSKNGRSNEKPVHKVKLSKNIFMGKYPVTKAQYQIIMESKISNSAEINTYPYLSSAGYGFSSINSFIKNLNKIIEVRIFKSVYEFRLPTEAEWEYACRASTTTDYYWGDKWNEDFCWPPIEKKINGTAFSYQLRDVNFDFTKNKFNWSSHPIGEKKPNQFGLYDMVGNVWQLCNDWYGKYSPLPEINPTGSLIDRYRVIRGGHLDDSMISCRSAFRESLINKSTFNNSMFMIGLRLVLAPVNKNNKNKREYNFF